jgi:hypothetical protein
MVEVYASNLAERMMSKATVTPAPYYDIALSFAGEDRALAERIERTVSNAGYRVFYDVWQQHELWGEDLYAYLHDIYRDAARFCVIFISAAYARNAWTHHELKSAQERALQEHSAYILPLRVDDTPLPGLFETTSYLDLRHTSVEQVCEILLKKLRVPERGARRDFKELNPSRQMTVITRAAVAQDDSYVDDLLVVLRTHQDPALRARAAWALDNISSPTAIPGLLNSLSDPDWQVRSNAGWALVHLGLSAKEGTEAIATTSSSAEAREMAVMVLKRLRAMPVSAPISHEPSNPPHNWRVRKY